MKTLQEGEILSQASGQVLWKKTTRKTKKQMITREKYYWCTPGCDPGAPECAKIHSCAPGCQPDASWCAKLHLCVTGCVLHTPVMLFQEITVFLVEKTQFFSRNPVGNHPINTTHLIHNDSFRTNQFKRKANTRSFKGGVYLLILAFRVCFISCELRKKLNPIV